MNSTLNLALKRTSRKLSVDLKLVESVYKSYWLFIREYVSSLPLEDMSQTEFDSTVNNISLPYIGKLYVEYKKIDRYKERLKLKEDVKTKENKADRLSGISD